MPASCMQALAVGLAHAGLLCFVGDVCCNVCINTCRLMYIYAQVLLPPSQQASLADPICM